MGLVHMGVRKHCDSCFAKLSSTEHVQTLGPVSSAQSLELAECVFEETFLDPLSQLAGLTALSLRNSAGMQLGQVRQCAKA
jgi:hypothetical protein